MPRFKLTIEYDGAGLVGWQRQANGLSVQEILETAVERYCGQRLRVNGAGRTDAGVHALGQIANVDLPKDAPTDVIRNALNQHAKPHAVSVLAVAAVDDHFDARRSARGRYYRYRILNRRAPAATTRGHVWHVGPPLDTEAMQQAASLLLGKHDFSTFRDSMCQAPSPVKTLDALDVIRDGDEVHIEARARSFLHHQVRNMVGTLKLVGLGKWRVAHVSEALAACDRRAGGPTAPPEGLYLVEVIYAERPFPARVD
jgi:tRNA pseudouridine38-40 synthase